MYTCSIGYKIAEGQNEIFIEEKKIGEEYLAQRGKILDWWIFY